MQDVVDNVLANNFKIDHMMRLSLNLEEDVNKKLIKAIKSIKLPQVNRIYIKMSKSDIEDVQDFITHSFPDKVDNFNFSALYNGIFQKIGNVYELVGPVLDRVSNEINIKGVDANSEQINQIVRRSKN